jgi:hypothetical protein
MTMDYNLNYILVFACELSSLWHILLISDFCYRVGDDVDV